MLNYIGKWNGAPMKIEYTSNFLEANDPCYQTTQSSPEQTEQPQDTPHNISQLVANNLSMNMDVKKAKAEDNGK